MAIDDQIDLFPTMEEAIEAAHEQFLADYPDEDNSPAVGQFNLQKYVMQEGDVMWQAEFLSDESDDGELQAYLSGEAAQRVFDGDFDEIDLRQEWPEESTLYEWDEGEFQHEPPLDSEEGRAAAEEWEND